MHLYLSVRVSLVQQTLDKDITPHRVQYPSVRSSNGPWPTTLTMHPNSDFVGSIGVRR